MTSIQTSSLGRAAITTRLSDTVTGLNARLTEALSIAGLTLPVSFRLPLDFTTASKNFFAIDIEPEDFERSLSYTLPLVTLYSAGARNANLSKFRTFSGPLEFAGNLFLSWPSSKAPVELEQLADIFQDCLIATFNAPEHADWSQTYNPALLYDGDIEIRRGSLKRNGENWSVALTYRLAMDCFTT